MVSAYVFSVVNGICVVLFFNSMGVVRVCCVSVGEQQYVVILKERQMYNTVFEYFLRQFLLKKL